MSKPRISILMLYVSLPVDKSEARMNGGIEIKGNEMYLAFRLEEL